MISKEEVQHIAKLARLGLAPKEIEKLEKELSKILDYMAKLKEVDISKVEVMRHAIPIENVMREDQPKAEKSEVRKKLLEAAPAKKEGYVKVKSIFHNGTS